MRHLNLESSLFGTRGSEVQILSPRPIFLSPLQHLTQLLPTSIWTAFSVHSVQLKVPKAIQSRFHTPQHYSSETQRYLSPCRKDHPSTSLRDPTSSPEDPWDMRFRSSGTCSGNDGMRGFPPCDLPCADSHNQASSAPDADGDEGCWTTNAASHSSSGTVVRSSDYR